MPELPDIFAYESSLRRLFVGAHLEGLRIAHPFVLRTFAVSPERFAGRALLDVGHLGKRLVLGFEGELFGVIHLMVAGRLKLVPRSTKLNPRVDRACWEFSSGSLLLTEVSKKKRASLHLFASRSEVATLDRGGIDPLGCSMEQFRAVLSKENRTLKRALTDQRWLAGIGNAYSDEILFWAELSPVRRTGGLEEREWERLFVAVVQTLGEWTRRLVTEAERDGFPKSVTAFREGMAVHGRFGQPCVRCRTTVQRIRYADNETNYCPRCQTEGKLLADRSLSRLLKGEWPRTLEELEEATGLVGGKGNRRIGS